MTARAVLFVVFVALASSDALAQTTAAPHLPPR